MSRIARLVLGVSTLLVSLAASPAGAGGLGGETLYEWLLHQYLSDGAGGFGSAQLVESGSQADGAVSEGIVLGAGGDPHAEVFSSEAAGDVWGLARSPFSGGDAGEPIGARAELRVSRIFRKDAADATLRFTIPQSELSAAHFFGPENEGFFAMVIHVVEAGDFFAFFEQATLEGVGGAWSFVDSGVLPYEVTQGGLDESSVSFAFSEPFVRDIDLSSVLEGEEFAVQYRIIAEALDTVQAKSSARAFGRDPADPSHGVEFETTGLTPIPAPEPGAPLLLGAGAAMLLGIRRGTCWTRRWRARSALELAGWRLRPGSKGAA